MTSIERPLSVVVYVYVHQMHKRSHGSVVYKRAGMHFVEQQNLQKHRAMDENSFHINDDVFLATTFQPVESFIEVSLPYLRHYSYPWGQDPAFLCHVRSNIS